MASELRVRIESGDLTPGARVPSITTLMQEYGIARNTARHALAVLADEGLIEVTARMGIIRQAKGRNFEQDVSLVRMARAWIELTGEQAGWGPARVRMAGLGRAGYVCEVLAGSGPLVLVLTGRKLSVSELLAIGGPPARRYDPGRFPDLRRHLPGRCGTFPLASVRRVPGRSCLHLPWSCVR